MAILGSSSMPSHKNNQSIRSSMVFYHKTLLHQVGSVSLQSCWLSKGWMWMYWGKCSISLFHYQAFIATYFVITSYVFSPCGTSYGCPRPPWNFAFLEYTNSIWYTDIPGATPTDTTMPLLILQPPMATQMSLGLCSSTTHTQIQLEWRTRCLHERIGRREWLRCWKSGWWIQIGIWGCAR